MAKTTLDKNGNILVDGYTTNLTPEKYNTISTASMTPTTPTVVTPATPVPMATYTAPINTTANDLATAQENARQAQIKQDEANAGYRSISDAIGMAQAGNVKDVAGTYNAQGVNTAYNTLQDLASQATGLKNEASAIPIQIQNNAANTGATDRGVAPIQTQQLRDNALKALSLGQQYAIAEGNYNKAKNYADQLIETKYAGEEARIKALQTQQASYDKTVLTPAEQKRLEATKKATDLEATQLAEKKANDLAVSKLIIDASQVAPADVLTRAKDIQAKGGSATEVAMALGQYGGNYYAIEKAKQEVLKLKAETNKIARESNVIPSSGGTTGGTADLSKFSSSARAYINAIQRGETTIDAVMKQLGSTKAALGIKNEIQQGLDIISGGQTGNKIVTAEQAGNFKTLLGDIANIDITAYGQADTPGGLIFDIRNPTTAAYVDRLVSSLSLEKRELLKGSGAISDFESRTLANAASILGRKNISETAAQSALNDVQKIFKEKIDRYNTQTGQTQSKQGQSTIWDSGDTLNQKTPLSSMGQKGYINPNAPFGEVNFNLPKQP